ncbi:MAG: C39 family peptidase, partial [Candidatus Limnocylindria bacterium]
AFAALEAPAPGRETTSQRVADPAPAAEPAAAPAPAPPGVEVKPALPRAELAVGHVGQSLNNCGPASVVMVLTTFGLQVSQEDARLALRGPDWRRGMGPTGVGPWVEEQFGLRAVWRLNGTPELMKTLVTNGFAPMVTQWLYDPTVARISHWRVVRGYDDARGLFYTQDPFRGPNVALSYDWFDDNWMPFSFRYLVVYAPEDEALVRAILGDEWYQTENRSAFYERTKALAEARPSSATWLAHGEAAYRFGLFAEAVAAFEQGIALGSPSGVFTLRSSYPQALAALGRHEEADAMAARLSNVSTVPAASTTVRAPDRFALWLAAERARPFDAVQIAD